MIDRLWGSKAGRLIIFISIAVLSYATIVIYPMAMEYRYETALDEEADRIIALMSRRDLLGSVIHVSVPGKDANAPAVKEELKRIRPGGVILFGYNMTNVDQIAEFNRNLQATAAEIGIPDLFISTDQEGGRVIRVPAPVIQHPGALAMGQADDPLLAQLTGFKLARQLRQIGINVFFAPVLDINNNPANPVIGTRSFGSDPQRVIRNAIEFEKGARDGGSLPVIKHFPGHGNTNIDSHLGLPIINASKEELMNFELKPFSRAIEEGSEALMSAHIVFPALDKKYPATLSKPILGDLLRDQMNFDGLIFTDALEMKAIYDHYREDRPGVKALLAGADVLLLTSWDKEPKRYLDEITAADAAGEFTVNGKDILKEAARRQIRLKLKYGLLSAKWSTHPVLTTREGEKARQRARAEKKMNEKFPELNKTLSEAALRVLRPVNDFPYPDDCSVEGYSSIFSSKNRKGKGSCLFKEVGGPAALRALDRLAEGNADKRFIALYKGNPFEYRPASKNLQVVYSFSTTTVSTQALTRALDQKFYSSLKVVDLILPEPGN